MSLIIATGSNQGDKKSNLKKAAQLLSEKFSLIKKSHIYRSAAVDFTEQPDFYNQVLEFYLPEGLKPEEILETCLEIEKEMGRIRNIPKGPRVIDIDVLFLGLSNYQSNDLQVPHPRLFERSFVIRPLSELPYFVELKRHFNFKDSFEVEAFPI